jgi:hypothetical protein
MIRGIRNFEMALSNIISPLLCKDRKSLHPV